MASFLDITVQGADASRMQDALMQRIASAAVQEVGFCHMRVEDGVNSRLQLSGLLAKLCKKQLQSVS